MQVPDLTTVVNHMGFAGVPGGTLPEFTWWANIMSLLATLPNVYVKISGGQVQRGSGLDVRATLRPYMEHLIQETLIGILPHQ